VTYKTTFASRNDEGYNPPNDVARYLNPKFSKLLFFNGELANDLMDGTKSTNAEEIIDTFYGLYHVQDLKNLSENSYKRYLESRKKTSAKAANLARLEANLDKWRKQLVVLERRLGESKDAKRRLQHEIKRLKDEMEQHSSQSAEFNQQKSSATAIRDKARNEMEQHFQFISARFPNPVFLDDPLRAELSELAKSLHTLKLPEPTSRVFFDELIKEPLCLCDREMNDAARAGVKRRAAAILGDPINGFLNGFKIAVGTYCVANDQDSFTELFSRVMSAKDQEAGAQSQLDDVLQKEKDSGDEELQRKGERLNEAESQLVDADAYIEDAERPSRAGDTDSTTCVAYFKTKITDGERQQAELVDSLDRRERTEALNRILEKAHKTAQLSLKKQVILQANAQLKDILKFNLVQIGDIDRAVKLNGQAQGSVGH
jgi:DNA sulfur modification protein DndD